MGVYLAPGSYRDLALFKYDEHDFARNTPEPYTVTTPYAVASPPGDVNTVFVVQSRNSFLDVRLYTSHDAGLTWDDGHEIFSTAISKNYDALTLVATSASTLYLWNGDTGSTAGRANMGVWKSTNAGVTWTRIVTLADTSLDWYGMFATGPNKLFWGQMDFMPSDFGVTAKTPRWGQWTVFRANLDGAAQEILGTIQFGPRAPYGGVETPQSLLLHPISDDSVLAIARVGTSTLTQNLVPPAAVTLGTSGLMVPLGSPVSVTPELDESGNWSLPAIRVHFDSSNAVSDTSGSYNLRFDWQTGTGTWTTQATYAGFRAYPAGDDWWTGAAGLPDGNPRNVRFYIANNASTHPTLTNFRVDQVHPSGWMLRVDAGGSVTDLNPSSLRRPYDVLPLTATDWILAGAEASLLNEPHPVTVAVSDDAGSTWSVTETVPADQGFNCVGLGSYNTGPLLAVRTPGSTTEIAMSGAALGPLSIDDSTPELQQLIWTSDDAGATWASLLNTADTITIGTGSLHTPGFVLTGPLYVPPVAIPSRLATIVG
jgi:hypothetical protein